MTDKTASFLFGCKNLYHLSIHPFDFKKAGHPEYKKIMEIGKGLIGEIGLQNFAGFIAEPQYRVYIWSSMITLEFGKPKPHEVLESNKTKTIHSACPEIIEQKEINELPKEIIGNKKSWIDKIKTCYNL